MSKKNFELGKIVMTIGISEFCKKYPSFIGFINHCLDLYQDCYWGCVCEDDKQENDEAVIDGERILAAYKYLDTNDTIWIITEWDRSVTTILFPDEY